MQLAQQILFILISAVSIWLFTKKVKEIRRNIKLGRDEEINDNRSQRWKKRIAACILAKKMFRNPMVAVLHFFCICRLLSSST
jgi:hypothetical protein